MNSFTSGFKAFTANVAPVLQSAGQAVTSAASSVDLNSTSTKFNNSFRNLSQTVKERSGNADDLTELPQEYLDLERRVDGLKAAHIGFLKVAKAYDHETYDYPTQLQESVTEIGSTISHNLTFWAAAATKGTNLPQPTVTEKAADVHKTLPHALSRAAATAAVEVGPSRLSDVLKSYAVSHDKIGAARVEQDDQINKHFLAPWNATLHSSLSAAVRSRANVKSARISLDASRGTLKSATGGPKQEQARMEVEAAEERLVLATEEAINLMRAVLENPEPIRNLTSLIKAQAEYHAKAAETLNAVVGDFEEQAVAAESEYRKARAQ